MKNYGALILVAAVMVIISIITLIYDNIKLREWAEAESRNRHILQAEMRKRYELCMEYLVWPEWGPSETTCNPSREVYR